MFAGPVGFVMLLCEWVLLYFSWVHPWAWRQQQQQQQQQQQIGRKRLGEGDDDDLADAACGRVELGLLSQDRSHASDDDVEALDREQHQLSVAGGSLAAPAAQAAAIRALYDDMGPTSRTQKVAQLCRPNSYVYCLIYITHLTPMFYHIHLCDNSHERKTQTACTRRQ